MLRPRRFAAAALHGSIFGAVGHAWYTYLDKWALQTFRLRAGSLALLAFKIPLDCLFGLHCLLQFLLIYNYVADGNGWQTYVETIREGFLELFAADCGYWVFIQALNFKYVPTMYQLAVVEAAAYVENTTLSLVQDHGLPSWLTDIIPACFDTAPSEVGGEKDTGKT